MQSIQIFTYWTFWMLIWICAEGRNNDNKHTQFKISEYRKENTTLLDNTTDQRKELSTHPDKTTVKRKKYTTLLFQITDQRKEITTLPDKPTGQRREYTTLPDNHRLSCTKNETQTVACFNGGSCLATNVGFRIIRCACTFKYTGDRCEMINLEILFARSVASTFVIGILVYLLVICIRFYVNFERKKKFFDNLPGYSVAEKHWLTGHISLYVKNNSIDLDELQSLVKRFPKLFRIWFGFSRPSIQLVHPDTIKIMLKTSEPKPLGIGGNYRPALPWLGEGLLLAGGAKWARSRRLLTPAFHFEILKPYQTIYNSCTDKLLGLIDTYAETGESFELFQLISNCTLDIILQCAFSYQTDCQKDRDQHPYCRAISNVANLVATRNRNVLYFIDFIWNMSKPGRSFNKDCDYIHSVADKVIESRKQVLAAGKQEKKKYLDFLDILLSAKDETGIGLSPADIRAEVDTFMFEGHDTTTSGISWILYELAKNQSYQKLCQQEVDKVLRDNTDFVTWENLSQFDILTQCIKEGMRIHPPVPIVSRQSTKEVTIEGVTFPPDTTFSVNIYGLHHNPAVWKDHMTYDPSRFSKDRDSVLDSYAFIPFSAGPRNCIGQNFAMNEEKTVIARILERYTLELDLNHTAEQQTALVMRAQNGIHCKASRRK